MQLLIQQIETKNSWGKNELSKLLADTSTKYSHMVLKKPCSLNDSENIKENIVSDTCLFVLGRIQSQTNWGKNIVKDMIFKKLVEEVSC